jgi:hypothetical protein
MQLPFSMMPIRRSFTKPSALSTTRTRSILKAGKVLAAFGEKTAALPQTVQRRIIAANYRRGTPENARALLALAANDELKPVNRRTALIGLKQWTSTHPDRSRSRNIPPDFRGQ